jgi:hypothetical protein
MASVNELVDTMRSPLQTKVEDGEFHCRASRRRATYYILTASGREQISKQSVLEILNPTTAELLVKKQVWPKNVI